MNVMASQLGSYANILLKLKRKYHVVIANDGQGGPEVNKTNMRETGPKSFVLVYR
jgi:hypothetical protein